MANDNLLSEFEGISKEKWKEKLEADLKGKPYSDFVKTNGSGIEIEAIYTSQDVDVKDEAPGSGSFRRGSKNVNNDWVIDEVVTLSDNPAKDNKKILQLLNSGLTGITLSGEFSSETLKGILPEYISLGFSNYQNLEESIDTIKSSFGDSQNLFKIYLNQDPIGTAAQAGKWDLNSLKSVTKRISSLKAYQGARVYTVNAQSYHNAGGNAVSELAFALAHAHEYLVAMLEEGLSIDDASAQIKINLAAGGDYFQELAKIRAFRMMWAKMIEVYAPEHNCSKTVLIHSISSQFLSTLYDPYVNMLRATTQTMSAALGGADLVRVLPYNTAWKTGDDFSNRIARNVQLLLKEESYFDKVIDPAGGAYYIEYLTDSLAQKAWSKFQKIEKKGGFIGLMTSGNLARELREDAEVQLDKLNNNETQVLGVTLYPNKDERMIDQLEETEINEVKSTEFDPIKLLRLVGEIEESRLNEEVEA